MKTTLYILVFVFAAFGSKAQSLEEIISKSITATGGADKVAKLQSYKVEGKLSLGQGMEAPFTIEALQDKGARFEMSFQGMTMVQCVQGEKGWGIMPFQGKKDAEPMTPDQVRSMADQMDIQGLLYDYAKKGHAVEYIGKEDLEGTEVHKIKITKKNGDLVYKYLDAETFLELKSSTTVKVNDAETKNDMLASNYKQVDGYTLPFSLINRNTIAGQSFDQTMTIDKITINPVIDESKFVMPAKKP
jgi:hypothetical protein